MLNAGHPLPLLIRGGKVIKELGPPPRLPLGIQPPPDRPITSQVQREQLEPGDRLLFYTDGVTEARDNTGAFFGEERLVELTEHAAAGLTPVATLAEPAVLLGLAAQLAVAAALVRLVRTSHEVGAALAAARRRGAPAPVARPVPAVGAVPLPLAVPVSSLSRRGPPPARAR